MRIPRIYFDGALKADSKTELTREQAHYLGRVLRLKAGRELILFNGQGGEYLCCINELDGKHGSIKVDKYLDTNRESPLGICLAIGLSKGDRFDWAIQKATELGVASIQPLQTERTEIRLTEDRLDKKLSHWKGVVQSACEQSGRTHLPTMYSPKSLLEYLEGNDADLKIVLDPDASARISEVTLEPGCSRLNLLVGPEGGFSRREVDVATRQGFVGVRMGSRVLRTETAPIAALAVFQSRFGDW